MFEADRRRVARLTAALSTVDGSLELYAACRWRGAAMRILAPFAEAGYRLLDHILIFGSCQA
jgi:hypothetical protein